MALPVPRPTLQAPPHDPQMPFRGASKPAKKPGKSPGRTPGSATAVPPPPPPLSDAELIQQMITAAQLPSLQAIQNQQSASELAAKNQATTTQGYYEALAQALSQIGTRTQAGYSQAAGADAAFGKGFANGLSMVQDQAGAQTNDALSVAGAPAAQTAQATAALGGTGATDALYGLGGYIPASTMNREGAAFGAAANMLPATAAGQGAQTIQQIGNQQRLDQQGFAKQFADLAAQVPGLSLQFGQQLQSMHAATQAETDKMTIANAHETDVRKQQALTKYIADLNAGVAQKRALASYIAATGEYPDGTPTAKTKVAQNNSLIAQQRANVAISQYNLAVDRFNAAQKNTAIKAAKPDASLSSKAGYFVDSFGNPLLDSKGHVHVLPGFTIKGGQVVKTGTGVKGLTAKQMQDYKGQARRIAEGAFKGLPAVPNANNIGNKFEEQPKVDWGRALQEELAAGVPIEIALNALNAYYTQQGQRGRPWNGPPAPVYVGHPDRNPKGKQ